MAPSAAGNAHLLSVVSDRRQDGAQRLEAHGDVQQMGGEEEVVEVSKDGHGGVPDEIEEGLEGDVRVSVAREEPRGTGEYSQSTHVVRQNHAHFPDVVLGIDGAQPVDVSASRRNVCLKVV